MLVLVALCAVACGSKVRPLDTNRQEPPQPVQVLVVPLQGALSTKELALCHRALREAAGRDGGMQVVFHFDHAGSLTDSTSDMLALLDRLDEVRPRVQTTALVEGPVHTAAAWLALSLDRLYFLRRGEIMEILPPPSTWEEITAFHGESVERDRQLAFKAEMKSRLERRKVALRSDAAKRVEALADPLLKLYRVQVREGGLETTRVVSAEELTAMQAANAQVRVGPELSRSISAAEADELGIAQGTVDTVEQLTTDVLGVDRRLVGVLNYSWAEQMVGWLELLQPALLVLGFVFLLLEVKTPGLGLPGALGVLFLGLAMFYSYLVGLAEITEILLFFLGLAAIAVEIFVLPGMIVFGAVGFLALVFALVLSRQTFVLPSNATEEEILLQNMLDLTLLAVLVGICAMLLWRLLPYIPWLRTALLPAPAPALATGASTQFVEPLPKPLVGRTGRAETVLRPSGVAEIDGQPYDVVTRGEYVEAGAAIQVAAVMGNRIVVERLEPPAPPTGSGGSRGGESGNVGLVLLIAVVGIALLVAEVIFVSFGILSVLSGVALISAVFLAFQESEAFGTWVLIGEAVLAPIAIAVSLKILPKTRIGRALLLEGPAPEAVRAGAEDPALQRFAERTGVTLSALRPSGYARIDGQRVDVVTRGEMIDAGETVRVVEVRGNRVVVARERKPTAEA